MAKRIKRTKRYERPTLSAKIAHHLTPDVDTHVLLRGEFFTVKANGPHEEELFVVTDDSSSRVVEAERVVLYPSKASDTGFKHTTQGVPVGWDVDDDGRERRVYAPMVFDRADCMPVEPADPFYFETAGKHSRSTYQERQHVKAGETAVRSTVRAVKPVSVSCTKCFDCPLSYRGGHGVCKRPDERARQEARQAKHTPDYFNANFKHDVEHEPLAAERRTAAGLRIGEMK